MGSDFESSTDIGVTGSEAAIGQASRELRLLQTEGSVMPQVVEVLEELLQRSLRKCSTRSVGTAEWPLGRDSYLLGWCQFVSDTRPTEQLRSA